jgi:rhodanese-related sulfurtransferase
MKKIEKVIQKLQKQTAFISVDEFSKHINKKDSIIIDIREPFEYVKAKLEAANQVNIPRGLMEWKFDEFKDYKNIFLICKNSGRCTLTINTLKSLGYNISNIKNVEGGMLACKEANYLIHKAKEETISSTQKFDDTNKKEEKLRVSS